MGHHKVRECLAALIKLRMVSSNMRAGRTTSYHLTAPSSWVEPLPDQEGVSGLTPLPDQEGAPAGSGRGPLPDVEDEGNSLKGTLFKGTLSEGELKLKSEEAKPQITSEDIYQAYPKKVAKAEAMEAIAKQMKHHSPQMLLTKTQLYADAVKKALAAGVTELKFIPYGQKWFNKIRFLDDPDVWSECWSTPSDKPKSFFQIKKEIDTHEEQILVIDNKDLPLKRRRELQQPHKDAIEKLREELSVMTVNGAS